MRLACAGAARDFQAGIAGRGLAWPEHYPGLDLAFLQMPRPAPPGKIAHYISQHHHWLRLVQQHLHSAVSQEIRQQIWQETQRLVESRFEKHDMQRLQQISRLLLAVPAIGRIGNIVLQRQALLRSVTVPAEDAGAQRSGKNGRVQQRPQRLASPSRAYHFQRTGAEPMSGQADRSAASPLILLMPHTPAAQAKHPVTTLVQRLAGIIRQTALQAPQRLFRSVSPQRNAAQAVNRAAAAASRRPGSPQPVHAAGKLRELGSGTGPAQPTAPEMRLALRYSRYLDRHDFIARQEQRFYMWKNQSLRRQEVARRGDVLLPQLVARNRMHARSGSQARQIAGSAGRVGRDGGAQGFIYKSIMPRLPATGARTVRMQLQAVAAPGSSPSSTAAITLLAPMNSPAAGDQVSLQPYQAGFTAALAYRRQAQVRQAEVQRQIERIEHTVHTKVVREIMHDRHNQQHIRSVVTAAMLSPQMVQALARQVHASIEQRAGIDRYRRGR
ncbi:hypothetical protein V8G57_20650 [Collimonas sp. H4R21]|uniref:Uncharacterized protein n=1 Tax=Collimonas rhizosphaerae TaxID=3126357 RepID=A0ABU9Q0P9_9BURK